MSQELAQLIADILDIELGEVKSVIVKMSLNDLVHITDAIKNDDSKGVFEIYNGYLI